MGAQIGMTPERALEALRELEKRTRPWHGMRRVGASSLEIVCTKCSATTSTEVTVGDEALNAFLLDFMGAHQHDE